MKKILLFQVLLISLITVAQSDTAGIKFIEPPDSTGFGTPDGKLVGKEIGPTGGTIISDDGRLELIFPEGALTANTMISIQPTANLAPNGAGKSYKFEPSGTQFKKPVGIIIHYSDEEAEECPPDLMGMAMQDHTGKWNFIEYEEWDSLGKVLKGFIEHFSGLSNVYKLRLRVRETEIRVNRRTSIEIVDITRRWDAQSAGGVSSLVGEYRYGRIDMNAPVLWYVNGIQNGNRSVGSIEDNDNPTRQGNAKHIFGTFTAPEFLPKNPANVKVDIYVFSGKRMAFYRAVSLRCKIKIYDEYKITVSQDFKVDDDVRLTDTSIFLLRIGIEEGASISGINNQLAKLHIGQSGCQAIYDNASTCVGMINVTGIRNSKVTPTPNGFARVDIFFSPATLVFPVVHYPPCGHNRQPITTPPTFSPYAFPMWLGFEAKHEKQYISFGTGAVVSRPDPEDITATIEPIRE